MYGKICCIDASAEGLSLGHVYELITRSDNGEYGSIINDFGICSNHDLHIVRPMPDDAVITELEVVIHYKFDEESLLKNLSEYIDATYGQHYAAGESSLQTLEEIGKEPLRGFHFCQSNVIKYASRCEHKGTTRKDLVKAAHYSLLALYHFEKMEKINGLTKDRSGSDQSI